jgi:hypothetical protein
METPDRKRCRRCDRVKPAAEFYRDRANRDGLNSYCKRCNNRLHERSRRVRATR